MLRNSRRRPIKSTIWATAACFAMLLPTSGCNDAGFLDTYPATGHIHYNSRPMTGARLTFYPLSKKETMQKVMPKASVNEDGSFTVYTYKVGDGAPAGEYKMTVTWPNGPDEKCGNPDYIEDMFYGRFASVERSNLQVTIEPKTNELPAITLK